MSPSRGHFAEIAAVRANDRGPTPPRYCIDTPFRPVPSPAMTDIACVGGVLFDERGRLLLIRRGHDPGRGLWSLPGGRIEPGEDDPAALVREMAEETGLVVAPGRLVGTVVRGRYVIADYLCEPTGG